MMSYLLLGMIGVTFVGLIVYGLRKHKLYQYFWRRILMVWAGILLIVLVAVAPIRVQSDSGGLSNTDLIIVADLTQSMNAVDGRGGNERTRIEDMRDDIRQLANDYAGASVGLYTFSDVSGLYLPLTIGSDDINNAVDTLYTATQFQTVPKVASYKDVFHDVATYVDAQKQADPTRRRIVVFMSDFEIYKDQEQSAEIVSAAKELTDHGASFAGVVYGTTNPAKMLLISYDYETHVYQPSYLKYGDEEYSKYLQESSKTVFSSANPGLAEQIATATSGSVVQATTDQDKIKSAVDKAASRAGKLTAQNNQTQAIRQNPFYVVPAVLLLAWLVAVEIVQLPVVVSRLWRGRQKGAQS